MKILKPLIYASIITLSVGCNNNSTNNVDEKSNIIDVDNNIYELEIECKQNGDTIVGISHNDLYAIILRGPKNTSSCCANFGCDYEYETPQEIILYDLLTKEKQILFRSHQKIKHKEGSKDAVEWNLNNFAFPDFVEDKDGAALLLWEIDHGNDGYLFPLNEHNFEKKYFYPYYYSEYELSQMINDNDTNRYVWYDWNYLQHDDINNCPIGYYRLYKINTKGDIIWEDDSLRIFREGGESPIGGTVIAKAHARILNDMDNFKSELAKLLRGYAEYGNASMGVKYLLEVTYTTSEYFCSSKKIKKETETCNIIFEISQDTRTILNEGKNGYIPELILIEDSLNILSSYYCPDLPTKYKGKTFAFRGWTKTKKIDDLGFEYKNAILFRSAQFNTKNIYSFKVLSVEEMYIYNNEVAYSNCELINEEVKEIQKLNNDTCEKGKKEDIQEKNNNVNPNNNIRKMPEFKGGYNALYKFLGENLIYPQEAEGLDIYGEVIVTFIVNTQGEIENIEIKQSVHPLLDNAAIDVVKKLPKFVPGEDENGNKIPVTFYLPIKFKEGK